MKKIYVKRKTLLIVSVVLVLVITTGYFATPSLITHLSGKYSAQGNQEAALALKDRLFKYFPGSEEARNEIFALADQLVQEQDRVMIGPNFTGGGGSAVNVDINEVINYLQVISDMQKEDMWKYTGYEKIGNLYRNRGDYDTARMYYEKAALGFARINKDFKVADVNGELVRMYLQMKDYNEVLSIISQNLSLFPRFQRAQFLAWQGDAYYNLGQFDKACQSYHKAMEQARLNWEDMSKNRQPGERNIVGSLEEQEVYRHSKARLEMLAAQGDKENAGWGSIEGRILKLQKPMPNVLVYLINEKDYDGRINHLENVSAQPPVMTDIEGSFTFNNVWPGRYMIVLGVVPQDLKGLGRLKGLENVEVEAGKTASVEYRFRPRVEILEPFGRHTLDEGEEFQIRWKPVSGAHSYSINLTLKTEGGYISRVYKQDITGASYTFKWQGVEGRECNFVIMMGDDLTVGPSAILGSFYPGAEIYFIVEAFDDKGRSISDSEGYVMLKDGNYPSIKIGNVSGLSEGDRLVLDMKYPQAINAYKKALAENPKDVLALLSLARIYNYGWKQGTANPEKAMEYYERVLELAGEVFIVEEAADACYRAGQYERALELYQEIEDQIAHDSFWFHHMGELSLMMGDPQKAVEYYERYLKDRKELRDMGPVMAWLHVGDIDGAVSLLESKEYSQRQRYTPESHGGKQPADVNKLIELLKLYKAQSNSSLSWEEFQGFLIDIIKIHGKDRSEQIKEFQSTVESMGEDDVLVKVLIELSKDRY